MKLLQTRKSRLNQTKQLVALLVWALSHIGTVRCLFVRSRYLFLITTPAAGYYEPDADEVIEDGSLLQDETLPDDLDDDDPELPVRVLEDFTIYDSTTLEIVHLAQLLLLDFSNSKYGASGLAKAWADPDSEDDDPISEEDTDANENSEERLRLSDIREFWVHNLLEGQKVLDP